MDYIVSSGPKMVSTDHGRSFPPKKEVRNEAFGTEVSEAPNQKKCKGKAHFCKVPNIWTFSKNRSFLHFLRKAVGEEPPECLTDKSFRYQAVLSVEHLGDCK